jgi:hypothetical protein
MKGNTMPSFNGYVYTASPEARAEIIAIADLWEGARNLRPLGGRTVDPYFGSAFMDAAQRYECVQLIPEGDKADALWETAVDEFERSLAWAGQVLRL